MDNDVHTPPLLSVRAFEAGVGASNHGLRWQVEVGRRQCILLQHSMMVKRNEAEHYTVLGLVVKVSNSERYITYPGTLSILTSFCFLRSLSTSEPHCDVAEHFPSHNSSASKNRVDPSSNPSNKSTPQLLLGLLNRALLSCSATITNSLSEKLTFKLRQFSTILSSCTLLGITTVRLCLPHARIACAGVTFFLAASSFQNSSSSISGRFGCLPL